MTIAAPSHRPMAMRSPIVRNRARWVSLFSVNRPTVNRPLCFALRLQWYCYHLHAQGTTRLCHHLSYGIVVATVYRKFASTGQKPPSVPRPSQCVALGRWFKRWPQGVCQEHMNFICFLGVPPRCTFLSFWYFSMISISFLQICLTFLLLRATQKQTKR